MTAAQLAAYLLGRPASRIDAFEEGDTFAATSYGPFRVATSGDQRAARHAGSRDAVNAAAATMAAEQRNGVAPMCPI